jgi:hypothetical protein
MKSKKFNILVTVLISSVLLLSACIGTVYAYLSASADGPTDSFQIADSKNPEVSVSVTQEQPTKSIATASVTVPDAGYKVYVRAIVVVNWVNNGQICATPGGASYEVTADDWTLHDDDGFYYYNQAVDYLNDSFEVTYRNIDGYDVQVQVICQTIQAVGTVDGGTDAAVFEAWDENIG